MRLHGSWRWIALFLCAVFCENGRAISLSFSLNKDTIYPQAPLNLELNVQLADDEVGAVKTVSVPDVDLVVQVLDEEGNPAGVYSFPEWSCVSSMNHLMLLEMRDSAEGTESAPFGLWGTTDLPPGKYLVEVSLTLYRIGFKDVPNKDIMVAVPQPQSPPLTWRLPLTVLEPDEMAVSEEYESLISTLLRIQEIVTTTIDERDQARIAANSLAYARESAALPFQMRLILGEVKYLQPLLNQCHYFDMLEHFIESDWVEAAEALVQSMEAEHGWTGSDAIRARRAVVWTIHRMHERGTPAVVRATEEAVKRYPKPRDPRPVPGLD